MTRGRRKPLHETLPERLKRLRDAQQIARHLQLLVLLCASRAHRFDPFHLLGIRILDEEKMLTDELPGYREYRQQVRYRLVPNVW